MFYNNINLNRWIFKWRLNVETCFINVVVVRLCPGIELCRVLARASLRSAATVWTAAVR